MGKTGTRWRSRSSGSRRRRQTEELRTSDTFRTSDIDGEDKARAFTETCEKRRTSVEVRTSDMTDVRTLTDVRQEGLRDDPWSTEPMSKWSDIRHVLDVRHTTRRTSETHQTSELPARRSVAYGLVSELGTC